MIDSDDDYQDSSPTGTDAPVFDFAEVEPNNPTTTDPDPTSTTRSAAAAELLRLLRESSGTTSSSTTRVPPVKPKIGGIVTKAGYQVAWTGGCPLVDWSALDPTAKQHPTKTTQLRDESHSIAYKLEAARSKGMEDKFSKGKDLDVFISKIWKHLVHNGMDSITYVPDPADPNVKMSSVVEMHARFTLDHVADCITTQLKAYDDYDNANDSAATLFLMNSVDEEIYKELDIKCNDDECFPIVFMQFMKIVRTITIERISNIKARIQGRRPQQYSGQDIAAMALDFTKDAMELERLGHYEHTLTVNMLDAFLMAGGSNAEQFRFPLRHLRDRLGKKALLVNHLSPAEANKIMVREGLTYKQICSDATDSYRIRLANDEWGPARSNPDSKKVPSNFGLICKETATCVDAQEPTMTASQVNALIQAMNKVGDRPTNGCFNCGDKNHFARDCPKPKKKDWKHHVRSTKYPGDKRGDKKDTQKSWKKKPPSQNEPTSKKINGREWHWCRHCNSWSTTHGTDGHTNDKTRKPSGPSVNAAYTHDFAIWNVEVTHDTPLNTTSTPCLIAMFIRWILGSLGLMQVVPWFLVTLGPIIQSLLLCASSASSLARNNPLLALSLMHWMLLMMLLFAIRWFPNYILPKLNPRECAGDHPDIPRNYRRRGPALSKRLKRQHCKIPGSYPGFPNQRPRIHQATKHSTTRHYHQQRAARERLPMKTRFHSQAIELLDRLVQFEQEIRFQRAKLCAEGGGNKHTSWNRHRCQQFKKFRKHTTRHTLHGLTNQQFKVMKSPIAKAYINNAELPSYLLSAAEALKAALSLSSQPSTLQVKKDAQSFQVIWDSGASISISFSRNDFVGSLEPPPSGMRLQGIAKHLNVEGIGHVAWSFIDVKGQLRTLKLKALFVPKANVRLLSTSSLLASSYPDEQIHMTSSHLLLSGAKATLAHPQRNAIEVLIDPLSNLPTAHAHDSNIGLQLAHAMNATISTTMQANHNLSPAEKELMRWHLRLGHLSFRKVQFLMRSGVLAHSEGARRLQANSSKLTSVPMCAACQFGKQKRRPMPGKRSSIVRDRTGVMKDGDLYPGQRISVDHFVCSTRGRLLNTYGKEPDDKQYVGGAIFVDHATGFLHVVPQVNLNSHETLAAKISFEKHCRDLGVLPQSYQSDNAKVFTSVGYTNHLEQFQQIQTFAGVGAHHHNSVAERAIHTVVSIARTMMLHSAIHWPDVANAKLWNLAIQHAVHLYNHMPNESTGLSPSDLFTKTRWPHSRFHDIHVWGCPIYVLDKTLADGKKLPKWKTRSERSMYMGMSPNHASSVPLVLNLETGKITPQFHVVFDDWFATVSSDLSKLPTIGTDEWQNLFGDSIYQFPMDDADEQEDDVASSPSHRIMRIEDAFDSQSPATALPVLPPATSSPLSSTLSGKITDAMPHMRPAVPAPIEPRTSLPDESMMPATAPSPSKTPQLSLYKPPPLLLKEDSRCKHMPPPSIQREDYNSSKAAIIPTPSRAVAPAAPVAPSPPNKPSPAMIPTPPSSAVPAAPIAPTPEAPSAPTPAKTPSQDQPAQDWLPVKNRKAKTTRPVTKLIPDPPPRRSTREHKAPTRLGFDGSQGRGYMAYFLDPAYNISQHSFVNPFAHKARATRDPDTLSFQEAMDAEDRDKWIEAAQAEISALEGMHCWDEVPMSEAASKIIPGTFVFRRKRMPDGEVKKYKGRFCVRGDLQADIDDAFAPVVAWSTTRTVLSLAILWQWVTCSVDFSNAFVHAFLKEPIWIHLPRGFRSKLGPNTCLRLRRSLYGTQQAPKLWYEVVSNALLHLGLKQSNSDQCLFIKKDMLVVLYVDDAIICAKTQKLVDLLVDDLRKMHFTLTLEGTFAEYLGIKFEKQSDGSYLLTQRGLTEKIIKATGLESANPNWLPSSQLALGTDNNGPPLKESWKYSSIVGMLLYLSSNTRPDIAYAVSQVSRFNSNPKQCHAAAVKTIVRYLLRTRDKGLILRPSKGPLTLNLYVDADFAGLHGREDDRDPNSVKSRMGYIIFLNECPVYWLSKLLPFICCSTLESEYASLSMALKTLIPLQRMLEEIMQHLDVSDAASAQVSSTVFEDNNGALLLAQNQRITNRTKYFLIKWHWFWQHASKFVLKKIDSKDQRADFLTKGLPRDGFEHNRRETMGW